MVIQLKENMRFLSKDHRSSFKIKKYDYYGDGDIWCAFTDKLIYPLTEINLDEYFPIIDHKLINEKNEYID